MAPALELGLGALEVLSMPGTGRVAGVYSKAAYLKLPVGLMALTTLDVPSGAVHARTSVPLDALRVGDKVVSTGNLLQAGPTLLDLAGAEVWRGSAPTAARLEGGRRLALDLLDQAPAPALAKDLVESARDRLRKGDLSGTAGLLGGVGPGLTPAGDDCLAGILLIASMLGNQQVDEIAAAVKTNDISGMFLHWAARGQSIEPVHRFLVSTADDHTEDAAMALKQLTSFGHSSGADIALGLKLGLESCSASR